MRARQPWTGLPRPEYFIRRERIGGNTARLTEVRHRPGSMFTPEQDNSVVRLVESSEYANHAFRAPSLQHDGFATNRDCGGGRGSGREHSLEPERLPAAARGREDTGGSGSAGRGATGGGNRHPGGGRGHGRRR